MFVYLLCADTGVQNVAHQVVVDIMSSEQCHAMGPAYSPWLTDNMVCVRYAETDPNVCYTLSGSALVCRQADRWWQHGFVSWGASGCVNATQPEVHSSVARYLPWIEQNTIGQFLYIYCM